MIYRAEDFTNVNSTKEENYDYRYELYYRDVLFCHKKNIKTDIAHIDKKHDSLDKSFNDKCVLQDYMKDYYGDMSVPCTLVVYDNKERVTHVFNNHHTLNI